MIRVLDLARLGRWNPENEVLVNRLDDNGLAGVKLIVPTSAPELPIDEHEVALGAGFANQRDLSDQVLHARRRRRPPRLHRLCQGDRRDESERAGNRDGDGDGNLKGLARRVEEHEGAEEEADGTGERERAE